MGAAEMKPHVEQHVKINPGGLLHCTWFPRTRQNGKVRKGKVAAILDREPPAYRHDIMT